MDTNLQADADAQPVAETARPIRARARAGPQRPRTPRAPEIYRHLRGLARDRHLPEWLAAFNAFCDDSEHGRRALFHAVRHQVRAAVERDFITIDDRSFKLLSAVASRTLGWGKLVEEISYRTFTDGIRGPDGDTRDDKFGMPIFSGTGHSSRRHTVRLLDRLDRAGIVEKLQWRDRRGAAHNAWMPTSRARLRMYAGWALDELAGRVADGEAVPQHQMFDERAVADLNALLDHIHHILPERPAPTQADIDAINQEVS